VLFQQTLTEFTPPIYYKYLYETNGVLSLDVSSYKGGFYTSAKIPKTKIHYYTTSYGT